MQTLSCLASHHPSSINTNPEHAFLFLSPESHLSGLVIFTLHLPSACQYSRCELCLPLCSGSCSFISLSERSGASCPGTASVRDVVMKHSMKAPHFPLSASPSCLHLIRLNTLLEEFQACRRPNGCRYHSSEVRKWRGVDFVLTERRNTPGIFVAYSLLLSHLLAFSPLSV